MLRQAQGFERLSVIPEGLQVGNLALAHREDLRHFHFHVGAVANAPPDHPHDDPVARVDEADRFDCVGIPGLAFRDRLVERGGAFASKTETLEAVGLSE
jgi:hypothetical protein